MTMIVHWIVHWVGTLFPSFPHPLWSGGTTQGVGFFQHVFGFIQGFLARLLLTERTLHAGGATLQNHLIVGYFAFDLIGFFPSDKCLWHGYLLFLTCVHSHSVLIQVCSSASANAGKTLPWSQQIIGTWVWKKCAIWTFPPDTLKTNDVWMVSILVSILKQGFDWKWWIDQWLTHLWPTAAIAISRNGTWCGVHPASTSKAWCTTKKVTVEHASRRIKTQSATVTGATQIGLDLVWDHWYPLVN